MKGLDESAASSSSSAPHNPPTPPRFIFLRVSCVRHGSLWISCRRTEADRQFSDLPTRDEHLPASVYSMLLLAGAMIATSAGRSATPATYLEEALAAASVLAVDRNDLWTAFGPTNVAIHQINVAAATNDRDTGLASALRLDVTECPRSGRCACTWMSPVGT